MFFVGYFRLLSDVVFVLNVEFFEIVVVFVGVKFWVYLIR